MTTVIRTARTKTSPPPEAATGTSMDDSPLASVELSAPTTVGAEPVVGVGLEVSLDVGFEWLVGLLGAGGGDEVGDRVIKVGVVPQIFAVTSVDSVYHTHNT